MPLDTLVPLPVAVPFVVAGLLAAARHHLPRMLVDGVSLLAAVAVTGLGAMLLLAVSTGREATWSGGWQPHNGMTVGILLVADPVSAGLVVLAGALTVAAFMFSWRYFPEVVTYFHALMLVFLAGLCGFALSGDLFNMFVFFELMGVAAYALTGFRTEQPHTVQGALTFGVVNSLGGYVALFGIALIYAQTGELGLAQVGERLREAPNGGLAIAASFVLICTGWLVKAAIAPFHFWSADAHAVAPTPVCALFSGVMSQLGIYAVARTYWTAYAGSLAPGAVSRALIVLGVVTAVIGAIMTYTQDNLKRLLAFSTIAHIGLYLVAVSLLDPAAFAGAALFVIGDAAVKSALFFGTGILLNRYETVEEGRLHGRGRGLPVTGAVFVLGGLFFAGLPPFATYAGKSIIEDAAVKAGHDWIVWTYILVTAVTGGAVLRVAARVFLGWGPAGDRPRAGPTEGGVREESEHAETERGAMRRPPWTMIIPGVVLVVLTLVLGASTAFGVSFGHAAAVFTDTEGYMSSALSGVDSHAAPHVSTDAWKPHGLVTGLTAVALAVAFAATGVWRRRLPGILGSAAHPLVPAMNALRGAHSGHVGDYIAWLLAGVAGFAALLILP